MASQETTDDPSVLQDFSGGLNTLTATNRLGPTFSPSSTNCWYDDGALQKRLGQLKISSVGNGDTLFGRAWYGYSMHVSVFSGAQYCIIYGSIGVNRNMLWYVPASGTTTSTILNTFGTGTASTAVATAIVAGSGTNWLTTAAAGAMFAIGTTIKQIQSVDSDTQLTLTGNFGVLNSGTSYIITNTWAASNRVSFADMNSKVWICGPGSTTVSWDGTTEAFVTAFPQANYSLTMSNYMFAANTAANPSRVFWSSLKDPTTWPGANFVDVNPNDGFPIVGLFYDGQSMVILKTNSAWKLTGDTFDPANPTYTLTQIYTPSDFVINSPKSVQRMVFSGGGEGYIMLGKQGLYVYGGSGVIDKLFQYDIVRSEFANIAAFNWGNVPSVTAEPASATVDGSYWLQVPYSLSSISSADKELTYVIDKTGAIWRWQATANGIISDLTYLNGTLYGVNSWSGGTSGFIQLNTGNSDAKSTAISGTYQTKVIEFKNMQRFGLAYLYYKKQSAGNLTFSYSIDGGSFTNNTIDMTSGSASTAKSAEILVGQIGRSIQFQWSNATAAQTFEVYGVEFDHQDLRS